MVSTQIHEGHDKKFTQAFILELPTDQKRGMNDM